MSIELEIEELEKEFVALSECYLEARLKIIKKDIKNSIRLKRLLEKK